MIFIPGHGIYLYANGNRYKGENKTLFVCCIYLIFLLLSGDYLKGVKQGFGQFWWTTGPHAGDKYLGQFKSDRRHGFATWHFQHLFCLLVFFITYLLPNRKTRYGQYIFSNGDMYEGNWRRGKQDGQGMVRYSNGNLFEGTWNFGLREGVFIFTFPNGERYQALFKDGDRHGPWTKMDPLPSLVEEEEK